MKRVHGRRFIVLYTNMAAVMSIEDDLQLARLGRKGGALVRAGESTRLQPTWPGF